MQQSGRKNLFSCGIATVGLFFLSMSSAVAANRETRDYAVYVDGKPAGDGHLTIEQRDDGVTVVDGETNVKVRFFIFKYSYWYRGREIWKNGRLHKLDSSSNDDGKQYTVAAVAEDGLRVHANGLVRRMPAETWATSYWCLPDAKVRTAPLTLLDADTGRALNATLENLGEQQIPIGGRAQPAKHYRLTGDVTVDLWFDANERMVRQEWLEKGYRTLIQLTRVTR
jgi:hypothetical protein